LCTCRRLRDDEADALARVQRRVRVLEDHHHLAPDRPHLGAREVRDVAALEDHAAAGRVEQAHHAARHRRLAAARLADDAERLALLDREADAVDRLHRRDLLLEDDPARDGKCFSRSSTTRSSSPAGLSERLRCSVPVEQLLRLAVLRLLVEVARLQVLRSVETAQRRLVRLADVITYGQRGMEAAAARRVQQRRRLALDLHEPLDVASSRGSEPSRPHVYG
jgi:hypothetical protein